MINKRSNRNWNSKSISFSVRIINRNFNFIPTRISFPFGMSEQYGRRDSRSLAQAQALLNMKRILNTLLLLSDMASGTVTETGTLEKIKSKT